MKLVSYLKDGHDQLAFWVNDFLYDADLLHPELPSSMGMFLQYWDDCFPIAQQVNHALVEGKFSSEKGVLYSSVELLAPVPFPTSCSNSAYTAAHRKLPFGTQVKVTNLSNGKSVLVRVNDRGPFAGNRIIDLSKAAAQQIDMVRAGVAKVRIEYVVK